MRVIHDRSESVDLDGFLSRPLFGFLATTSGFGPRASPVWFLWEDGAIWIIGNHRTDSFPKRIEENPQCAIAFIDFNPSMGRVHHVGMRGRATLGRWDEERAKRILCRYLGSSEEQWDKGRFIDPLDDSDNLLVCLAPDTVVARDQSYRPSVDFQANDT